MKTQQLLTLLAITGVAILLPSPMVKAQDKEDKKSKDKQEWNKSESRGKDRTTSTSPRSSTTTAQRSPTAPWNSQNNRTDSRDSRDGHPSNSSTSQNDRDRDRTSDGRHSNSNTYNTRSGNRPSSSHGTYNRSNRYGGLWFPASTHSSWDRNRQHTHNNRHYRWYDGGWLIINAGYTPDYSYGYRSIEKRVQIELRERGYYRGPIDGDIGPGSSRAISRYQATHRLRVTGRINNSLLASLRL